MHQVDALNCIRGKKVATILVDSLVVELRVGGGIG